MAEMRITDAAAVQASLVGELLRASFAPSMLESSVYRDPSGDIALQHELEEGRGRRVRLADSAGRMRGVAIWSTGAVRQLDYIAVSPGEASRGIGGALLRDFEAGADRCSLDVFERNTAVMHWYLRHGYAAVSSRSFQVLDPTRLDVQPISGWTTRTFDAGAEIASSGFCSLEVHVESLGSVHLLAYGSRHVRLRPGSTPEVGQVLALVRALFPERDRLIMIGSPAAPTDVVLDSDTLWRLER